jgi:hypothetical protein
LRSQHADYSDFPKWSDIDAIAKSESIADCERRYLEFNKQLEREFDEHVDKLRKLIVQIICYRWLFNVYGHRRDV